MTAHINPPSRRNLHMIGAPNASYDETAEYHWHDLDTGLIWIECWGRWDRVTAAEALANLESQAESFAPPHYDDGQRERQGAYLRLVDRLRELAAPGRMDATPETM